MKGIDVSHYQGTIDFNRVRAEGYGFVILKATDGTNYKDPTFENNYKAARNAGLLVGAYHFARFKDPDSAQKEAKWFAKALKSKQFDIMPQLDLEVNNAGSKLLESMKAFFDELGSSGLYSFGYFYLNNLAGQHEQPLWYARYASTPIGVSQYAIWQHTSQARVPGIGGYVDENLTGPDWKRVLVSENVKEPVKTAASAKTAVKATPYWVTATALNIRQTPGGKILGVLKHNDRVQVISISNGWAKLKSSNKQVYVSSKYLTSQNQATKTTSKPKVSAVYHKVARGDTVSALSRKYGSSLKQIKSWNKLNSKYTIYVGEKIRVK